MRGLAESLNLDEARLLENSLTKAVSSTDAHSDELRTIVAQLDFPAGAENAFKELEAKLDEQDGETAAKLEQSKAELVKELGHKLSASEANDHVESRLDSLQLLHYEIENQACLERKQLQHEYQEQLEAEKLKIVDDGLQQLVDQGVITDAERQRALAGHAEAQQRDQRKRQALESRQKQQLRERMISRKAKRMQHAMEDLNAETEEKLAALENSESFKKSSPEQKEQERRNVRDKVLARHKVKAGVAEKHAENEEAKVTELLEQSHSGMSNNEHVTATVQETAKQLAQQLRLSPEASEALAKRLMDESASAASKLNAERQEREEQLHARLQAMKREKQRAGLAQQKALPGAGNDEVVIPILQVDAASQRAEATLQSNQERIAAELRRRHEQEAAELAKKVEEEVEQQRRVADEQLRLKKEQLLNEHKSRLQAELAARSDLSSTQANKLLAEHDKELKDLGNKLDAERNKTNAALEEKLAERKRKRQEELKLRQETEVQREMLDQKVELQELQTENAKVSEKAAMISAIQQNPNQIPAVIQAILEQRHGKEKAALEAQFEDEKALKINEGILQVKTRWSQRGDELNQQQAQDMLEIEALVGRVAEDLLDERRMQCRARHQTQTTELAALQDAELKTTTARIANDIQLKFNDERLSLSERHYREYIDALRELSPEHAKSVDGRQAQAAAQELESMRQRLEEQRLEQEAQLKAERDAFEAEQQRKLEADMAAYEKEIASESAEDKRRAEVELDLLNKQKEEHRRKLREEFDKLKSSEANPDQRDMILNQHEQEVKRLENALESEKLRQKSYLQDRLTQREEKKRKLKMQQLALDVEQTRRAQEDAELQRRELYSRMEAASLQVAFAPELAAPQLEIIHEDPASDEESEDELSIQDDDGHAHDDQFQVRLPLDSVPARMLIMRLQVDKNAITEQDVVSLLQHSGLLERLAAIEGSLRGMSETSSAANAVPRTPSIQSLPKPFLALPADSSNISSYFDDVDSKLKRSGDVPIPIDTASLDARNFVVYRFGLHVVELLSQNHFERVNVLLASMLPAPQPQLQNMYSHNAFRNSAYFDQLSCTLFIRQERLQSLGDFVLILVHSVAHIAAHSMENDGEPAFVRQFHRALRVCCEDLFMSRMAYRSASEPVAPLHSAMQQASTLAAKEHAVDEFINQRTDASLNLEVVKQRVRQYVGESETRILGGKLDLIDEGGAVNFNVQGRLAQVGAELRQLQAQASAQVLSERQRSNLALIAGTEHASLHADDAERKLKAVSLAVEKANVELTAARRNVQALKAELAGPLSDQSKWAELDTLDAAVTQKLIAADSLAKTKAALQQRVEALHAAAK